ncbi:hypothetical protein GGI04_000187 [Coemansia thaxteri]|nr:hypothetical protein GGI04_000187 [Coemansia thaxteri]KAJ2474414.1 hypothetical protein GGI02_000124 [Coemansia sp. RSA 2322]
MWDNDYNTLSEKRIMQASGSIRAKPGWACKLQNEDTVAQWKTDAKEQGLAGLEVDYVVAELWYYASLHKTGSDAVLSAVDGVWCSDSLIDEGTTNALKYHAAMLENVRGREKDWQPDSNGQVLNLVDPSLYPLDYQRSSVLTTPIKSPEAALQLQSFGVFPGTWLNWTKLLNPLTSESGYAGDSNKETSLMFQTRWPIEGATQSHYYLGQRTKRCYSNLFCSTDSCWLPAEFQVDHDGVTTIESYINNLHPLKHAALYCIIESIFSKFMSLLEQAVTDLVHPRGKRVVPDPSNWYSSAIPEPEDSYADDFDQRYEEWEENRVFVEPQPEPFVIPDRPAEPYNLRGRRLQAFVKMSNTELTPAKPTYDGTDWAVNGMANERIIATGIYFYDVENISDSKIRFRETLSEDIENDQDDWRGVGLAFGIPEDDDEDGVPLSQEVGHVKIRNGLCLVFPNKYQHRHSGTQLADPTRPGHCKTLVIYFVDPATRIPSTEIVPPQQQSWWAGSVLSIGKLDRLPLLVKDGIMKQVDFPMSLVAAKEYRLERTIERNESNTYASENMFERAFFI